MASNQEDTIREYRFCLLSIKALRFMGIFTYFKNDLIRQVFTSFIFLVMLVYLFTWSRTLCIFSGDMERFTFSFFFIMLILSVIQTHYIIINKRHDLYSFINNFNEVFIKFENCFEIPEHLSPYKVDKQIDKILKIFFIINFLPLFTHIPPPLVDRLLFNGPSAKYNTENWVIEEGLPDKHWWPFDISRSPAYEIVYIFQTVTLYWIIMMYYAIRQILHGLIHHLNHRFKILQYNLKNIREISYKKVLERNVIISPHYGAEIETMKAEHQGMNNIEGGCITTKGTHADNGRASYNEGLCPCNYHRVSSRGRARNQEGSSGTPERSSKGHEEEVYKQMNEDFNLFIQYHQSLLRACEQLENIIHPKLCFDLLISLILLCAFGFLLSTEKKENMSTFISSLFLIGIKDFTLCWLCTQLSEQSSELSTSIYQSDWTGAPQTFKRSILIVMIRSQRPVKLTMGKCGAINVGTFVSIMRIAYSNYTILRDLNSR